MRIHISYRYSILITILLFEITYGLSFHKLAHLGEDIANKVGGSEDKALEEVKRILKNLSASGIILDVIGLFGKSMPISKEAVEVIVKFDTFKTLERQDLGHLTKCRVKASSEIQNINKLKAEIGAYMTQAVEVLQKTRLDPQTKRIVNQMPAIGVYLVNMYSALNALIMHACGAAGGNQPDFKALPRAAKTLYDTMKHGSTLNF